MNDSFISRQRVQNSVLIAVRDIDGDGCYKDGGGGDDDDDYDDDDDNNNNNKFMALTHCRIVRNFFRKSSDFPICHHVECRWFCVCKVCPV